MLSAFSADAQLVPSDLEFENHSGDVMQHNPEQNRPAQEASAAPINHSPSNSVHETPKSSVTRRQIPRKTNELPYPDRDSANVVDPDVRPCKHVHVPYVDIDMPTQVNAIFPADSGLLETGQSPPEIPPLKMPRNFESYRSIKTYHTVTENPITPELSQATNIVDESPVYMPAESPEVVMGGQVAAAMEQKLRNFVKKLPYQAYGSDEDVSDDSNRYIGGVDTNTQSIATSRSSVYSHRHNHSNAQLDHVMQCNSARNSPMYVDIDVPDSVPLRSPYNGDNDDLN